MSESIVTRLVRERSETDAAQARSSLENFETIQTAQRDIDPLRTDEIYIFDMSVGVGCGKLKIDCGEIELDSSVSEAIAEADGRWTITIPIFRELTRKGTQLSTRRKAIQKKFLRFARPYWYVSKSDMPALRDEIFTPVETDKPQQKALMQLADELRGEALDIYDDAFSEFLHNVSRIGRKAKLSEDKLTVLLTHAAGQFPTRQEILSNFGVFLEGPIKIPSLREEAERDAQLAEAIAREQAAQVQQLELTLEQERIEAELRLQREQVSAREMLQRHQIEADRRLQQQEIEARQKAQQREEEAVRQLQDSGLEVFRKALLWASRRLRMMPTN